MIRAVVWKELREQGLIALTLAVLGGALLVATAMLADPPVPGAPATDVIRALGAARLVTLMLVVTAGMVCGGALFAAEKEAGTMSFLEALPSGRWALWRAKLVAGLLLAVAQVALLIVAAAALEVADGAFARRLLVYALLAFAWGALGSTLARTTLGSVGVAIPAATLASFVFLLPIYLFLSMPGSGMPRPLGWLLFEVLMVTTPLAVSWWRFTAPDRARRAVEHARAARVVRKLATANGTAPTDADESDENPGRAGLGTRALVWLAWRQLRLPGLILSAFAVAFGSALLLPDLRPIFVWPMLALAAGALVGVIAFGDEQSNRTAPFWGEHRLPIGRAWSVKIALSLLLLAWLLVLLALPCVIRAQVQPIRGFGVARTTFATIFHSRLFDELGAQTWKYLLVPAVYGFAFGHLCGLLFRKLVVACGVALMLGGAAAALWAPSLLAGGVAHWQVWLPAAAVLSTGRLLIRAWAGDRTADRGPVLRLSIGGAVAAVVLVAALGYRAVQVSDDPAGADDLAFEAALPKYDENLGGREFRAAAERFGRSAAGFQDGDRQADRQRRPRFDERLEAVARGGWPVGPDPELIASLDRLFADTAAGPDEKPWPAMAAAAADRPLGVFEPPALVSSPAATAAALDNAKRMATALLARGLQLQVPGAAPALATLTEAVPAAAAGDPVAAVVLTRALRDAASGDPTAFVAAFRTVTVLARNVRYGSGFQALEAAIEIERLAVLAADRWLDRFGAGAELPRAVVRTAEEADDPAPFDTRPHALSDRFVIRGQMQAPAAWLTTALSPPGGPPDRGAPEADLVAFAWSVPWEKERTRRLVGLTPDRIPRAELAVLIAGRPGAGTLLGRNRTAGTLENAERVLRVGRRALILKAAVRAYQAERGVAPGCANDLVDSRYLARVPEDPYLEGRKFGYRVSTGENLTGPPRPAVIGRPAEPPYVVAVKPGQVVLWSVGTDGVDQGGKVAPNVGSRAEDLVFVVPPPAH